MGARFVIKGVDGVMGRGEFHDGVTQEDVVRAMRDHRLFIVADPDSVTLEESAPKPSQKVPGGAAAPARRRGGAK